MLGNKWLFEQHLTFSNYCSFEAPSDKKMPPVNIFLFKYWTSRNSRVSTKQQYALKKHRKQNYIQCILKFISNFVIIYIFGHSIPIGIQVSGIIHPLPSSPPGQLIMSFPQFIGHETGHSNPLISRGPSNS